MSDSQVSDTPDDAEKIQLAMRDQLHKELQGIVERAYGPIFDAYRQLYIAERERLPALPEQTIGGAFVGTLLHVAAAVAVGLGMKPDGFAASAMESYIAAHDRVPKWG
jgi:hypothetical protein